MDSSKEKIEAQLCAYIEGELDDADRVDIERHLQTNPQHKSLMAELRRHRELLQTLPRATVPGELNENLTGQLERSALLSDDDETAEAGVRINRWPQLAAVAAVILLAVGLGIVVLYVLPPAGGTRGQVAAMEDRSRASAIPRAPASAPSDVTRGLDAGAPASTQPAGQLSEGLAYGVARDRMLSAATEARTPDPRGGLAPSENKPAAPAVALPSIDSRALQLHELTTGPGLVTSGEVEELQKRMSRTMGGEANAAFNLEPRSSVYLIVQTPDAVATSGQVAAYFKNNNIQYMNYEGPPIDLGDATPRAKDSAAAGIDYDASDLSKGGALGGGLFSPGAMAGRGARGSTGGVGGAGAGGPSPQASARPADAPPAARSEDAAQKEGYVNRGMSLATAQTQPANERERLYRRGLVREESASAAPATSRPYVMLSVGDKLVAGGAPAAPGAAAAKAAPDVMAEARVKSKTEGTATADKNASIVKDELALADRQSGAVPPSGGAATSTGAEGSVAQGGQMGRVPARGRLSATAPSDAMWAMRLGGPDSGAARGGVIVARMNRRQASELGVALSREQGQRAELRDFSGLSGTTLGKPATANYDLLAKADAAKVPAAAKPSAAAARGDAAARTDPQPATQPAADALRLTPHPMDEPVDVVIVVKPDAAALPIMTTTPATPAPNAAKSDADTKK
jgi:hypothetical protein